MLLKPKLLVGLCVGGILFALPGSAQARPSGPALFCETYPSSPDCVGRFATCDTCHTSTDPVAWNSYGVALLGALDGRDFDTYLSEALTTVEGEDTDGDGEVNLDEILIGTAPGNAESLWEPLPELSGEPNPWYDLGEYDTVLAYRRMMVLYCGYSPDYETLTSFRALDEAAQYTELHEQLALCLDADYWRGLGLRELADKRIKPIYSVGAETEVYFSEFRLVLADYDWDYRLWRYILSDDRDMRELLTAQYHVEEDGSGGLIRIEGEIANPNIDNGLAGGQPLEPEHRAGMLTTQWFLVSNTMFSGVPRTTAAQAYRAYLGMDISKSEGILPVEGEPLDIDDKGVAAPACAQCHATLDPLSYAFSYYYGIELPVKNGLYDEDRPSDLLDTWDPEVQQSSLLGQEIASVVEWGQVASESLYFRRAMTNMLFEHALGREALPGEFEELGELIDSMIADGYSANRMIHRIVDTDAFGVP
ncbi:DUF1585 domain-containing protein [Pseudenhygromyxa sp. WMMC2535]|uniref:DUF1585 domain-containing protein n=1 Tax=Pseudenhygromyxa sp. WMMC2535 TaxID=2712867 RepID=UPI00155312FF|nr:DUF1585 domain-containing protein [Pseudenhygromyxa sp. WMMC2535]